MVNYTIKCNSLGKKEFIQICIDIKQKGESVWLKGVEVNENVSWGCNAAINYGRENLLGYLIRQCLRRAVPRVVGRVRIIRQAAGAVRFCMGLASY